MTAEVLGTMISTAVAFAGMAGIFLIANLAVKAIGLGPVFMRPEDDPARKKPETDSVVLNDRREPPAEAAGIDPVQPERTFREETPVAVSELAEPPVASDKFGRLRTGLRRARLLTTVIVFGLSVVSAIAFLNDETPEWASACGWQVSGRLELNREEQRSAAQANALEDIRRLRPDPFVEQRRKAVEELLADGQIPDTSNGLSPEQIAELKRRHEARIMAGPDPMEEQRRKAIEELLADQQTEELERREFRRKAYDLTNESSPDDAAEALKLGEQFGVPRQAIELDPDMWRKRNEDARRRLLAESSPRTMAWLDNSDNYERSCWSVTEIRLKALGLALLPAILFFLMTFVLVSLGRWLFVLDRPR